MTTSQTKETEQQPGLQEEIKMLRDITLRVYEKSEKVEDLAELLKVLNPFGMTLTRLGTLLKLARLFGGEEEYDAVLDETLKNVISEMKHDV